MKLMEAAKKNSKSKNNRRESPHFVICLDNKGSEVSLGKGKVYRQVKGRPKDMHGWIRVVDESREDYLFPDRRFVFDFAPPGGAAGAEWGVFE